MTIEEFLLARIRQTEMAMDDVMMPMMNWEAMQALFINMRCVIEWHKNWPVLMQTEPEIQLDSKKSYQDNSSYIVTQKMEWLTQQAYREKFGSEPPTAPLLKKMAEMYSAHPDYNPEW